MPVIAAAGISAAGSILSTLFGGRSAKKAAKASAAAQERATQQMIAQADRAANLQYGLGREQLDFNRRMYEETKPMADEIAGLQMSAQRQQMEQAQDYFDYNRETFRPIEQRMAADAALFDTEAYQENLAQEASQRAALAFQGSQGALRRDMSRRGVDPNSGAFASMANQNAIAMAGLQATGANATRRMADDTAFARNLDVVGLGRNLPSVSTAAYQGATSAGGAAMDTRLAPGQQYNQGFQTGAQVIGQGFQTGLNAYGNILTNTSSMANNAMNNYYGILGSAAGAMATGAAELYGGANIPRSGGIVPRQTPQQRANAGVFIDAMRARG
jgi:hypothetical protein